MRMSHLRTARDASLVQEGGPVTAAPWVSGDSVLGVPSSRGPGGCSVPALTPSASCLAQSGNVP